MANKSNLDPVDGIFEFIFWMAVSSAFYMNFFFIPLGRYSFIVSILIFFACMLGVFAFGWLLRKGTCLNKTAIFLDLFTGIGVYSILSYHKYYGEFIRKVIVVPIVLSAGFIVLEILKKYHGMMFFSIPDRNIRRRVIKLRSIKVANYVGVMTSIISISLLFIIGYNRIVNDGIIRSDVIETVGFNSDYTSSEYSLAANIDVISKISSSKTWEPLTVQEKLNVVQAICNCEANYWGIEDPVSVVLDELDKNVAASYYDEERIVRIDRAHLEYDRPDEVLKSTLHEMYHAWQYELVRLYLGASESQRKLRVFEHCEEYLNEMQDYKGSGSSYKELLEYYMQQMEIDARRYAEEGVEEYLREIEEIRGK